MHAIHGQHSILATLSCQSKEISDHSADRNKPGETSVSIVQGFTPSGRSIERMDISTSLLLGVLFGSIGMGYIVYGKKQHKGMALFSGIALCIFPYCVSNIFLFVLIGLVLMALPFLIRC
jgi:hypothetical protein